MYINFKLQIGSQVFLNICVYISTCIYVCIEQQKILSFKIASTVIIFKRLIIFPEEEFTDPLLERILSELSERGRLGAPCAVFLCFNYTSALRGTQSSSSSEVNSSLPILCLLEGGDLGLYLVFFFFK